MFYKCKDGLIINLHLITNINTKQLPETSLRSNEKTYDIDIVEGTVEVCEYDYKKILKLIMEIK